MNPQAPATEALSFDIDADGIGLVCFDQPSRRMNVLNAALVEPFAAIVARLESDAALKGLVLTSGKPSFVVGADIDELTTLSSAEQAFRFCEAFKRVLRRLESCGKPVVAALNGGALGGGLELALACHARIAVDDPELRLGLPEVKLGLLPGGGGTQRLPRLIGIQASFELITQGRELRAAEAKSLGLVDALAAGRDELLREARAWCLAHPRAAQPWDRPGFAMPGGDSRHPDLLPLLAVAPSMANAKAHGNYPAIGRIMSCLFEGGLLGFDAACQVESRYFAACAMSQESKNLIATLWYQLNAIKKGHSRPPAPPSKIDKLGILGAGMMGAGIAHVSAQAGIGVVLLDTTLATAEQGKAYSQGLLDQAVARGRCGAEQREQHLARIQPSADHADLAGCELVIEAVFEDRALKADCTRLAETRLAPDALMASNTSTLPITDLAEASARPANFIGLHFFSPVDKMPLVEIIVGAKTSDETLARGFDYVRQIGKTPIVVNDSRGFYTSRVVATYLMEGLAMVGEGVHPRAIEAAGIKAGMPMPPLALVDELSLSLMLQIIEQSRRELAREGKTLAEHPGEAVLRRLVATHGRIGRKSGQGLYAYDGQDKALWPELSRLFPTAAAQPGPQEIIDRLLFVQANEAARCFEENVVRSVADVNIGSIFGWGFAPFHGGALQFINALGATRFVARAQELAARYGDRFAPAAIVWRQAAEGGRFEDEWSVQPSRKSSEFSHSAGTA